MRAMRTKVARCLILSLIKQRATLAQTSKQKAKKIGMQTRITHWPRRVESAPHSGLVNNAEKSTVNIAAIPAIN